MKRRVLYKASLWTRFAALLWRKHDIAAVLVSGAKRVHITVRVADVPFMDKIVMLRVEEADDVAMYIPEAPVAGNA